MSTTPSGRRRILRGIRTTLFAALAGLMMSCATLLTSSAIGSAAKSAVIYQHPRPAAHMPDQSQAVRRMAPTLALLSPDEYVMVHEIVGAGFRTFFIRVYDIAESDRGTREYALKSSHHLTRLGWPQPIVATPSVRIGARHWRHLYGAAAEEGVSTERPPYAPRAAVLWSGLAFNTLLYGMTSLAAFRLISGLRHRATSQRILSSGEMIAAAALWLAVCAAWLAEWSPLRPTAQFYFSPEEFAAKVAPIEIPPQEEWDQFSGRVEWLPGRRMWTYTFMKVDPTGTYAVSVPASEAHLSLGWPLACFGGVPVLRNPMDASGVGVFHMDVMWAGLLVDWAMFASMLMLVLRVPGPIVRRRRLARGECPACRYPTGSSDVCTECGEPLSRESRRQRSHEFRAIANERR